MKIVRNLEIELDIPGIYTKVSDYLAWIYANIDQNQ